MTGGYLLVWNPNEEGWDGLHEASGAVQRGLPHSKWWSCGGTAVIEPGDILFLLHQGAEPEGIIAAGSAVALEGDGETYRVQMIFETLLHPQHHLILESEFLRHHPLLGQVSWETAEPGMRLPEMVLPELLDTWHLTVAQDTLLPQELLPWEAVPEQARWEIAVNAFERSAAARAACLEANGYACIVCGFDFAETYGRPGRGLLHVHHLVPPEAIGEDYRLDPVRDLVPVCPNCHALIHSRRPPYELDEVRAFLR